jgi:prepilin signal peptidase PulO-like enzyme (type II secretory pathway)
MTDLIICAVAGGIVGVLINLLSDLLIQSRFPSKEKLSWLRKFSRPVCLHCQKPYSLRGYLFSFRCQNCGAKPSTRSFLVLILSIILAVLVKVFPLRELSFWWTTPIMIFLGIILVIDIEYHVVMIETSIFGLVLLAVYGYFIQGFLKTIIGGGAGCLVMLAIYYFGIFFSKIMAKIRKEESPEPGLGLGDVYIGVFLGFFAGWPWIIGAIIIAILLSGIYSFVYLLVKSVTRKYEVTSTIPYAPFLILGVIAIYYLPPL